MKTIDTDSIDGWALAIAAVVILLLSIAMSVNARDLPGPHAQRAPIAQAVHAVAALPDLAGDELEDLKAGNHAGLPGLY